MHVRLSTHGGFAAGIRRPPKCIDSDQLPSSAAAELARLVEALKSSVVWPNSLAGASRDTLSYTIAFESENEPPFRFTQSDGAMSPEFAALLDWIRQHA